MVMFFHAYAIFHTAMIAIEITDEGLLRLSGAAAGVFGLQLGFFPRFTHATFFAAPSVSGGPVQGARPSGKCAWPWAESSWVEEAGTSSMRSGGCPLLLLVLP